MDEILKEYPKAIASFLTGIVVTYLTGKIPTEYLSQEIISAAQVILGSASFLVLGRFTRLSKTEAEEIKS